MQNSKELNLIEIVYNVFLTNLQFPEFYFVILVIFKLLYEYITYTSCKLKRSNYLIINNYL